MERTEPALVPEWYKTGGIGSNSSNSNHHHSTTSNSDELGIIRSPRNKLSPSTSDHDAFRTAFSTDRDSNSSYLRSRSMNGSTTFDKDNSTYSRAYSNFNNRGHRDRGREKNFDYRDKKSSSILDNGYSDYPDISSKGRSEKDVFLWSQSKVPGRPSESQPKGSGNELNSCFPRNLVNGIQKSSFEREFPSLGSEGKAGHPETGRAPPTALNSVSQISMGTSVSIGREGWTSALAAVPSVNGSNLSTTSQQSTHAISVSVPPSTNITLNMAETLVKAPTRARGSPQQSIDTQRLEELAIKQSRQLIPVTPTIPKTSVLNSLERQKAKGIRTGNMTVLPKVMLQSPSQPANNLHRGAPKSDVPKIHQGVNFQVLNRERSNSSIPNGNKIAGPMNASKTINPISTAPNHVAPGNPKIKSDMIQSSVMEKRHLCQDRISFFNTIRNGSSANHSSSPNQENCAVNFSSVSEKPPDQIVVLSNTENVDKSEDHTKCPDCPNEEEKNFMKSLGWQEDGGEETLTAEEKNFMKSLGWQEDGGEETLTAEEIADFVSEYNMGHLLNAVI